MGILQARILEWGFPSLENPPNPGIELGLLQSRWILYQLSYLGSPLQTPRTSKWNFFLIHLFTKDIDLQRLQIPMGAIHLNPGFPWSQSLHYLERMLCLSPQVTKTYSLTPTSSKAAAPICILATLVVNSSPLPGGEPVFSTIFEQMFLGLIEGGFSLQESEASL